MSLYLNAGKGFRASWVSSIMGEKTESAKTTIKSVVAHDVVVSQLNGTATAPLGTSDNPSNKVLTLANVITFCRLILTLIFLVLFAQHDPSTHGIALACYIVAAVTDFLDGQVARATQTVSWVGKVMDPIMDRVLLFTGVLGLVVVGDLPVWVAILVIGRDVVLAGGTMWLRVYQKRPMDVMVIGKVATACLMGGFADMLLGAPIVPALNLVDVAWLPGVNGSPRALGMLFVYVGLVFSIITAVAYYAKGLRIRSEVLKSRDRG